MSLISIVVPCYNEEAVLPFFRDEILKITDGMIEKSPELSFEFLFINDGSADKTLSVLREYGEADERFKYVSFSRNFGKESAIYAGLSNAKGDYVVLMDADLQHPPEIIPEMYKAVVEDDFDCAATRRVSRSGDSKVLSFFSNSFYKINNAISPTSVMSGAQDFRFMKRRMVDAILSMSEYSRFSKGIFAWVGFDTRYIEVKNTPRKAGKTSWNFGKLLSYSIDGFTGFSTAPLRLASFLGILSCIAAVVATVIILIRFIITGETSGGYYTLLCTILLLGGFQLLSIGILGEYLSKTYLETKHRPIYIVKEQKL
ncbi:MAG: glycosyltransferase [Ruminococcus sp.]|jgi:glycosyltransferase involved in cell wall biosynthesis|nr:glycosyltransferase [Ruminococcus sp.]